MTIKTKTILTKRWKLLYDPPLKLNNIVIQMKKGCKLTTLPECFCLCDNSIATNIEYIYRRNNWLARDCFACGVAFQIYSQTVNWQNSHRPSLHVRRSINSRNVNWLVNMHCIENPCFRNDCVDKKWTLACLYRSLIIDRFCYQHNVRLKLKINQVLVLPITITPWEIW